MSELFAPIFGAARVDRQTDGAAWLAAMLDAERALTIAAAAAGLVPGPDAEAIIAACADPARFPVERIGRAAVGSVSPVVPLVKAIGEAVPPGARPYVHFGATSQDIMDTAAMLVAKRSLGYVRLDLRAAARSCADLARRHRDTLMVGRTLGQHAAPTTFGLVCAGWTTALDEALARVGELGHRLAAQLGGPTGTLEAYGEAAPAVARRFAAELDLAEPVLPWHTDRTRIGEIAGTLGVAAGVLGTIARDVVLLSATEVGEVAEAAPGGSSAMPHKRNPARSTAIAANVQRVPGLVATLLSAMVQEHQRAAGAWQAEWQTLGELLRAVGGASHHAVLLTTGLRVDEERMSANLALTGGLTATGRVAALLASALGRDAAHELVAELATTAGEGGDGLKEVLLADPRVTAHVSEEEVDEALDPAACLGTVRELVKRALDAHDTIGPVPRRHPEEERP